MNADATEPVTPAARPTPTSRNDWGPGGPQSSRPDGFGTIKTGGLIAKLVLIGLADAVGLWAIIRMISRHEWTFAIPTIVALGLLNLIYLGGGSRSRASTCSPAPCSWRCSPSIPWATRSTTR